MTRKFLLAAVGWATLINASGCVTCHHEALQEALCPTDPCEATCIHRGRVHLVFVNGCDLLNLSGLCDLRSAVNAAGFSKVHIGQVVHTLTLKDEIRKIHCNDPDARFVVVGFDLGAGEAEKLATYAADVGAAVDAVVLLDPLYLTAPANPTANTLTIYSDGWKGTPCRTPTNTLPGVGHLWLPTNPHVTGSLIDLMRESLARVPVEEKVGPTLLLVDDPAPLPWEPATPTGRPQPAPPVAEPIPTAPKKPLEGVLTNTSR